MRRFALFLVLAVLVPSGARAASSPAPPTPADPLAASLRRGDAYWHLMRARLAAGEGRNEAVAAEVEAAIALFPGSGDLRGEGAALLAATGRRGEAERMARRALEIDPSQPTALRVVAEAAALRALGPSADVESRGEAIRLYTRILKADARAPDEIRGPWAVSIKPTNSTPR